MRETLRLVEPALVAATSEPDANVITSYTHARNTLQGAPSNDTSTTILLLERLNAIPNVVTAHVERVYALAVVRARAADGTEALLLSIDSDDDVAAGCPPNDARAATLILASRSPHGTRTVAHQRRGRPHPIRRPWCPGLMRRTCCCYSTASRLVVVTLPSPLLRRRRAPRHCRPHSASHRRGAPWKCSCRSLCRDLRSGWKAAEPRSVRDGACSSKEPIHPHTTAHLPGRRGGAVTAATMAGPHPRGTR